MTSFIVCKKSSVFGHLGRILESSLLQILVKNLLIHLWAISPQSTFSGERTLLSFPNLLCPEERVREVADEVKVEKSRSCRKYNLFTLPDMICNQQKRRTHE